MPREFFSVSPAELSPETAYEVLTTIVQPRPIALLSTLSQDGTPNLAPFSFYMVGGTNPPSLMVSPVLGPGGRKKDSLANIERTGEFVVSALHRELVEGMNRASYTFEAEVSEWEIGGFTPEPSVKVKPPRVSESLAQFECRLFKIVEHGSEAGAARYVIGEVVQVHIARELWSEGSLHRAGFRTISRLGGPEYLDTASMEIFALDEKDEGQKDEG